MPNLTVTDTTLTIRGMAGLWHAYRDAHLAIMEWCHRHGLDPNMIPGDCTIERCPAEMQVIAPLFVLDEDGRRILLGSDDRLVQRVATVQLEAPPLPWPDEIWAAAS